MFQVLCCDVLCSLLDRGRRREADSAIQSSEDEQDGRESVSVVSNCSDTIATVRSTEGMIIAVYGKSHYAIQIYFLVTTSVSKKFVWRL
jgi:hypothetical protein